MATSQYPDIPLDLLYYLIWQMQQRQKAQQAARTRQPGGVQLEPGGGTDSTGPGPDTAGPMTSDERSTARSISGGLGGLATDALGLDGIMGSVAKGALNTGVSMGTAALGVADPTAPARAMTSGILGIDSVLSPEVRTMLGMQTHRSIMDLSPSDLQGLADKYGYGMTAYGAPSGLTGGVSVGPSGYGTTGPSDVSAPSVGNPDQAGMFGGGQTPGGATDDGTSTGVGQGSGGDGSTGGDTGGTSGGDSPGNAGDGGGSNRRKGGVFRASRPKTERITWGERGTAPGGRSGETAIFIPDRFQLPGLQENERVVRAALRRSLADILAGRRRSQG